MDNNYRRPAPRKPVATRGIEGFAPAETNTADTQTQPYRAAVLRQAAAAAQPTAPAARSARPLVQKAQQAMRRRKSAVRIDMSLPGGEGFNRHHMLPRIRRQVHRLRTIFLRTAIVVVALFIAVGSLLLSQGYFNLHKVFRGTAVQAASLQQNVDPNLLKGEGDGRVNVLLTGIGGPGHDGGNLTDTLMIASIDPVNNQATLLSIPRDLWVNVPNHGSMKINAAYETGMFEYAKKNHVDNSNPQAVQAGFTSIDQMLETVLGIPIHYNLLVNFQAFRQAVDTVGGVTVDVPTDLYDPTMAWENHNNPYLARAGVQQFDGVHALIYVRSRETSSDFARSQRQRAVLLALKQKTASLGTLANPAKLSGLVSAFGSNVQTDLSLSDASRIYSVFKKINNNDIQSISLAGTTTINSAAAGTDSLVTTGNLNGQSIVMPKAGLDNYDAIQAFVRGKLQDGYILKEQAKILVVNGTVQNGLAADTATTLKSYGYNVIGTASTAKQVLPSTVLVDLSHGRDKYTKHYLEDRFNTTAVTTMPDNTINTTGADFVVLLGNDESSFN